ncbi:MAG: UDP-glucose--hexose-1-phosphate uridylyltransferase [Oscillochloris sp.]|nr:UDP-glucose--hexose-1-phosphate uridylyltransferase [Oscillochloris sp.]
MFALRDHPHRRYNPLSDEWVLVSPHRTKRPWQGQVETPTLDQQPAYDPQCYLCPGNSRAGGEHNPAYQGTFVFTNDYSALLPDAPPGDYQAGDEPEHPLLLARAERGICRVVCFSPRHDLSLGQLSPAELRAVVDTWADQTTELFALPTIGAVQVFENRGAMMGASNPHPHGQIWATESVPIALARELTTQQAHVERTGRTLLGDYLALELAQAERLVYANDYAAALVPFWAIWPFETMVIMRRPAATLADLDAAERDGLADVLKTLTTAYDRLFQVRFPYSMGFHQRPAKIAAPGWHLHAHFYPPLLRSATVRKFMVGFELLGEPQRDITPEQAAERLRVLV